MHMKTLTILLFCLTSIFAQAQIKAVTENGVEVILFDDGSWVYQDMEAAREKEIPTNSKKFKKDSKSTFQLKSSAVPVGFYVDPKVWTFKKAIDNPDAEFELQAKEGDLYGMIITEQFEIPLVSLKNLALENAKDIAPDIKIVKEEYRTVNGLTVLAMQMDGTAYGIKFSYYGYYYSSEEGTVQFITYTAQKLIETYREKCDNLLNGLVEND